MRQNSGCDFAMLALPPSKESRVRMNRISLTAIDVYMDRLMAWHGTPGMAVAVNINSYPKKMYYFIFDWSRLLAFRTFCMAP
jgi:hypothetical protein